MFKWFWAIFSLSAPVLKIVVFNPLGILFLIGKNIFLLACDTDLHNYDRSHRRPVLGFVCYNFKGCGFQLSSTIMKRISFTHVKVILEWREISL